MTLQSLPEAPRYIPATPPLLQDWCGPILWRLDDGPYRRGVWGPIGPSAGPENSVWARPGTCVRDPEVFFDPERQEVRDHLSRRLCIPQQLREDYVLTPGQLAGVLACAAAGRVPTPRLLGPWREDGSRPMLLGEASHFRIYTGDHGARCEEEMMLINGGYVGWMVHVHGAQSMGKEFGDAGREAADHLLLRHGCLLMLDPTVMALPWPGGGARWLL